MLQELLYFGRRFVVALLTANVMQHAMLQLVCAPKERAVVYGLLAASSSSSLVAEPRRFVNLAITTGVGLGWTYLAATTSSKNGACACE